VLLQLLQLPQSFCPIAIAIAIDPSPPPPLHRRCRCNINDQNTIAIAIAIAIAVAVAFAVHGDYNGNCNSNVERGNGDDRSITCNGTGAGALGHWGNCNSTGAMGQQEAMAMGQWHCDHLRSIDRVDVGVCRVDVGRQHDRLLFRVFYSKR
jgi:hypothetical protein